MSSSQQDLKNLLQDLGLLPQEIQKILTLDTYSQRQQLTYLRQHLLQEIHQKQTQIECLDYLLFICFKEEGNINVKFSE